MDVLRKNLSSGRESPVLREPIRVSQRPEPDISTDTLFLRYRCLVPTSDPSWKTTATRQQGKIILTLQSATAVTIPAGIHFFSSDGQVDSNQKQLAELLPNSGVLMTLVPAESAPATSGKLTGVVAFPHGWRGDEPPLHLEIGTSPGIADGRL
jgi:hypothetical protein